MTGFSAAAQRVLELTGLLEPPRELSSQSDDGPSDDPGSCSLLVDDSSVRLAHRNTPSSYPQVFTSFISC